MLYFLMLSLTLAQDPPLHEFEPVPVVGLKVENKVYTGILVSEETWVLGLVSDANYKKALIEPTKKPMSLC